MTIIWCMIPEIWSMRDIIFCHSGLLFALSLLPMDSENQNFEKMKKTHQDIIILQMCTINDSHMMYGSWDMKCNRQNFLSFYPSMDPENQNFGKMKKTPEDIIILQMCTINDSHMMYGSWNMEHNRQKSLSFWTVLPPFTLLTTEKIKILKYYHFTHVYHK